MIIIKMISIRTKAHHGVWAPLGNEGMGLILWHHGLNQWHAVTDALQKCMVIIIIKIRLLTD